MSGLDLKTAIALQRQLIEGQAQSQISPSHLVGNPGTVHEFILAAGGVERKSMIDTQLPTGPTTGVGFSVSFGIQTINNPANLDYARAFVRFGAAGGSLLSGQIDLGYGQSLSVPGSHIIVDVEVHAGAGAGGVSTIIGAFATLETTPRVTTANEIYEMNNIAAAATAWEGAILPFTQRFIVFTSDHINDHFIVHARDAAGVDWYTVEQGLGVPPVYCPMHSLIRDIGIENVGAAPIIRAAIFHEIEL